MKEMRALITPEILVWARERYSLTADKAASRLRIRPDTLDAWESGALQPTFPQARKFAQRFNVPFGYLFLSKPPEINLPLPDLRTVSHAKQPPPSPEFLQVVNDAIRKQEWYREFLEEEGAAELPFIGEFEREDDPVKVARHMRRTLGIGHDMRKEASQDWEGFLRLFIETAEESGVLVMRNGVVGNNTRRKLSVKEFRGFVISDVLAPLIFINGADAKTAQTFTLAHELAHLWIGSSGVSNIDIGKGKPKGNAQIEQFCDRVAAEVLVPAAEFLDVWSKQSSISTNMRQLAREFRVSPIVILRRALDLHKISRADFFESYKTEARRYAEKTSSDEGSGGDFYVTVRVRNSKTLTDAVVAETLSGRLLYRDAAGLLGVRVPTFEKIAEKVSA